MNKIDLFNIKVDNVTMSDAIDIIRNKIEKKHKSRMYFVNADCFNKMHSDPKYYRTVKNAHYIFGDGSSIKLGKITGQIVTDNVNGTDMLPLLAGMCSQQGFSVFFLGASDGVAQKASQNLKKKFPDLKVVGTHHGFFDKKTENSKIVEMINRSGADVLLVAFGAPQQEIWIDDNFEDLNCYAMLGVGGLFDFFSGRISRAPGWMRVLGIEWVYRLIQEPKRMWRRYILGNPLFVYRVYKWKNSGKGDIHDR
jgi:N-acetylglucosaminyldiphosphoundecaprenol N-acetyl-beta-D-mannosaminyltransferase